MTRLLLAWAVVAIGIALIAPLVCLVILLFVIGDAVNLLAEALNCATAAASRGVRNLASNVEGDQP